MAPVVLSDEEWDALLIEGGTRHGAPFIGSRCDAWHYGCPETTIRTLPGTRLGLCHEHHDQLQERAKALGVTLQASTRLVYVVAGGEGRPRVWRRSGDQWAEVREPPVILRHATRTEST
jgi:hypothetical protein